jgi:hypothetical protein
MQHHDINKNNNYMIQLPNKWDLVTIRQWKEINEIQTESELTRLIEQMSILADCDPEEIRKMTPVEFNTLSAELFFLSEELKPEVKLTFELEGKKYGLIPDLNFISTGEFVDAENWKADPIGNIHLLIAMLYRPVIKEEGDEYEIEPHTSKGFMRRADLFLNKLPITIPYGAVLFFSASGIQFTEIIVDYLEAESKLKKKPTRKKKQTTQSVSKKSNKTSSTVNGPGII